MIEPPTCVLRGGGLRCGASTRISQRPPAPRSTRGNGSTVLEELVQSPLGVEAFLARSTLDLCQCAARLVPGGTGTEAVALRAALYLWVLP